MQVSDVTAKARYVLQDESSVRWTATEMYEWIQAGEQAIANARPESVSTTSTVQLTANAVVQSIPSTAFMLLDVTRNMGSDGSTPGVPVLRAELSAQQAFDTTWYGMTGEDEIKNYFYDPDVNQDEFYVYPRVHASTAVYVELRVATTPTLKSSASATLTVKDDYLNILIDYIVFRCLTKESEFTNIDRATRHYNQFAAALGLKTQAQPAARYMRDE